VRLGLVALERLSSFYVLYRYADQRAVVVLTGPTAAGAEAKYQLSEPQTFSPGSRSSGAAWKSFSQPEAVQPGDLFLFRVDLKGAAGNLVYLVRAEKGEQLSLFEAGFSESVNEVTVAGLQNASQAGPELSLGLFPKEKLLIGTKGGDLWINQPQTGNYELSVYGLKSVVAADVEGAEQRVQGLMETILRWAGQGEIDSVAVFNSKGEVTGTFPVLDDAGAVAIAPEVEPAPALRAALLKLVQASSGGNVGVVLDEGERELQIRPIGGFTASAPTVTEAGLEDLHRISLPAESAGSRTLPPTAGISTLDASLSRSNRQITDSPALGSLFKLIFRPENAGLALLLPAEGVQARIIVGSSEQRRLLLEIRPDLEGAILPLEEFDSVESAVEFARSDSQLGPDATEVPLVLSRRSRPLLRWQIETWLRPFPWKPLTLKEALLDNVMDILGVQV
jgi:hypothetical protein